jgi:hypothetical protein
VVLSASAVHAATAAHHGGGQGPLWFAAVMGVMLGAAAAIALWAGRVNRRALRVCPVCSAAAVRTLDEEVFSGLHASLSVECGACGTWRRILTTPAYVRALARALRRDRATIIAGIERSAAERRRDEIDALTRALGGG